MLTPVLRSPWQSSVMTSPSNAGSVGLIPGQEGKIPHVSKPKKQDIKQKQYGNKFLKTLKTVHIKKIRNKRTEMQYIQ